MARTAVPGTPQGTEEDPCQSTVNITGTIQGEFVCLSICSRQDQINVLNVTPVSESLAQTLTLTNQGTFSTKWSQLGPDGTEIRISTTPSN